MNIQNILHASFFTPGARGNWGLPIILWGSPGIAKTDIIEEVARRAGLPCETLAPGERGEAAFGVIPVPEKRGDKWWLLAPMPEWAQQYDDADGAGVIFVDELTTAPPAIQPALLGLFHARRLGGNYLGSRVRVIAAANPVAEAAAGYELSAPQANRSGHIDWLAPTVDDWGQWLLSSDSSKTKPRNAKDEEKRVMDMWTSAFARAKGSVVSFMKARRDGKTGRDFLYLMPKADSPNISRAWPSPRTWEFATRALASSFVHGLDDEETITFVQSFVGQGPAVELFEFMSKNDLPAPEDVLDEKVKFVHDERRLDRTMAVLASCTAFLTPTSTPHREQRAKIMWKVVLGGLTGKADDLCVTAVKGLSEAKLHAMPEAVGVLNKLRPVLVQAGLLK